MQWHASRIESRITGRWIMECHNVKLRVMPRYAVEATLRGQESESEDGWTRLEALQ